MSYTLKKLKQSEIDHGHQKPAGKINAKPSYGIFIVCFVITLSIFLVLLDQGTEIPSQQQISASKPITNSLREIPASTTAQKKLVNESSAVNYYEKNKKITLLPEEKALLTIPSDATNFTPKKTAIRSKPIVPNPIAQVEKELLIENPVNLKNLPEEQDPLAAFTTDVQTLAKYNDASFDSEKIETIQSKNSIESDNTFQNNPPILWQNLPLSFQNSMPKMKLNGIVHLENVKDRYVFINMTKYEIDDVVLETGPTIVEIQKNAVIMFYDDREFIFSVNQ